MAKRRLHGCAPNGQAPNDAASEGDLVLLPQRPAHSLKSAGPTPREAYSELLCGFVEFDAPDHPLFGVLPPVVHARPEPLRSNPRCAAYLGALEQEAQNTRDGSAALQAQLTEVLLIEVMRFFTSPPGVECPVGGWFAGRGDPCVRRALVGHS
jgi:cupin